LQWFYKCKNNDLKYIARVSNCFFFLPSIGVSFTIRSYWLMFLSNYWKERPEHPCFLMSAFDQAQMQTKDFNIFTLFYSQYFWRQIYFLFIFHGYRWTEMINSKWRSNAFFNGSPSLPLLPFLSIIFISKLAHVC